MFAGDGHGRGGRSRRHGIRRTSSGCAARKRRRSLQRHSVRAAAGGRPAVARTDARQALDRRTRRDRLRRHVRAKPVRHPYGGGHDERRLPLFEHLDSGVAGHAAKAGHGLDPGRR